MICQFCGQVLEEKPPTCDICDRKTGPVKVSRPCLTFEEFVELKNKATSIMKMYTEGKFTGSEAFYRLIDIDKKGLNVSKFLNIPDFKDIKQKYDQDLINHPDKPKKTFAMGGWIKGGGSITFESL